MNDIILGSTILLSIVGYILYYQKNNNNILSNETNIKLDKKYIKKIHDWIFHNFDLHKDPHSRQLGKQDVKRFAKLCYNLGIRQDDELNDELFMKVYQEYCNLLIKKYESKIK
jgi:hypothetical protein